MPDKTPIFRLFQRDRVLSGNRQLCGERCEVAVGQSLACGVVADKARLSRAIGRLNLPIQRRCISQHRAHGRARCAQAVEVVTNRARAIGVLIAIAFMPFGLDNLDFVPIRLKLVRDDLRHRGPHLLAHFRAVAGDLDGAVVFDRDPHAGGGIAARHLG